MRMVGSLFGLAAGVMLATAAFLASRNYRLIHTGERADGVVVAMMWKRNSDTSTPVVRFRTPDGELLDIASSVSSKPPRFRVGDQVRVLYPADQPRKAEIDSFSQLWMPTLILGGLGSVFALLSLVMLLSMHAGQAKRSPPRRGTVT